MQKGKRISLEGCVGKDIIIGVENIIVLKQSLSTALAVLKLTM